MMEAKRKSSPSRQRLSALSPLQALSPLEPDRALPSLSSASRGHSRSSSASSSSFSFYGSGPLSRSLSGRERVFHHAEPASGITTRLILVKAPSEKSEKEEPGLRTRSKSSSNLAPISTSAAASNLPATSNRAQRRSFASVSFTNFSDEPAPMSPTTSRRPSVGSTAQPTRQESKVLSPDEVLDLARGLMSPVAAHDGPSLRRRKSTGGSVASRPEKKEPIELEPVEYIQMDYQTLLPFSDRPKEVAELLEHPVNGDMYTLLKQSFPKGAVRRNWKDIDVTQWTWDEFYNHLTTITPKECPDYEWVLLARTAVRAHSVALWEQLGACLGCDPELITAGDEEDAPASWSGLGLGDDDEFDLSPSRVHIEALEAMDAEEFEKQESMLSMEFGDFESDGSQSGLWGTASMETIGEKDEPNSDKQHSGNVDPSPFASSPTDSRGRSLSHSSRQSTTSEESSSPDSPVLGKQNRSRSFVGLQIMTIQQEPEKSPRSAGIGLGSPPSMINPEYERSPGNPLFVTNFSTLSLGPNLGRKASTGWTGNTGGLPTASQLDQFRSSRRIARKSSNTGLSESAVTFVSDSSGF